MICGIDFKMSDVPEWNGSYCCNRVLDLDLFVLPYSVCRNTIEVNLKDWNIIVFVDHTNLSISLNKALKFATKRQARVHMEDYTQAYAHLVKHTYARQLDLSLLVCLSLKQFSFVCRINFSLQCHVHSSNVWFVSRFVVFIRSYLPWRTNTYPCNYIRVQFVEISTLY